MTIEIVDLPEDLPINSMVDLSSQLRKRLPEGQKNWALQVFFSSLGWVKFKKLRAGEAKFLALARPPKDAEFKCHPGTESPGRKDLS
jgi:hypothetical protein